MKRAAIITASDSGYRGEREDLSGPAIREILEREGYEVISMDILPDDGQTGTSDGRKRAGSETEGGLYSGICP